MWCYCQIVTSQEAFKKEFLKQVLFSYNILDNSWSV